jgi:hypothetical protein
MKPYSPINSNKIATNQALLQTHKDEKEKGKQWMFFSFIFRMT